MKATGQNRIFVAFIVIHGNNHVGQGLAPCPADRQTKATYRVSPDWSGTLNGLRTYAWQYAGGDGSLTKFTFPSTTTSCLTYTYDALKRLTKRTTTVTGTLRGSKEYTYLAGSGTNGTTTLVSQLKNKDGSGNVTQSYTYTYDNVGNILTVSGSSSESYTYDTHDKLKKAVVNGVTYTYTYDVNGNILSKSDGTTTDAYAYGNSVWVDLLTAYNGHAITYDTPGNPTSWYDGAAMTWVNGRRLASIGATSAHGAMSFTYDADGLRLTKTVGGVEHRYLWQNGKLVSEAWGDKFLEFFYDEKGVPLSFLYRSSATGDVWKYLYVTNLQGDVIGITTPDGESRAVYTYDPFGKPLTATGTMAGVNPLRYRGYYYDTESGLYYLKSRYYDPEICRFINADDASMLGANGDVVSYNLFAYCGDNPVNASDYAGFSPVFPPEWVEEVGELVETVAGWLYYVTTHNGHGDLYEHWVYSSGDPVLSRHHSNHGNSKTHPIVPHDHDWHDDGKGGRTIDTTGTQPNKGFLAPNDGEKTGKIVAGIAIGLVVYEVVKWVVAIAAAPETLGGSIVVAGVTP